MSDFKPCRINRGSVSPESAAGVVIGRDQLVERLWRDLRQTSVRVLSERRIGKTWALRLAEGRAPEWASCLFVDLEDCNSLEDFVEKICQQLHAQKLVDEPLWQTVFQWARRKLQRFRNTADKSNAADVMRVVATLDTWDELLINGLEQWIRNSGDKYPVLILDELPFLVDKLQQHDAVQAYSLLDKLRSIRQSMPTVRMIFCGSLGLHIVLDKLRDQNYHGRPVNDMPPFEVPPLDEGDAIQWVGGLLIGESITCSDLAQVAEAIVEQTSAVPFYIDHLLIWMCDHRRKDWSPHDIEPALLDLFHAPGDPGEFSWYVDRIEDYYSNPVKDKSCAILDILSRNAEGETASDLLNLLRHNPRMLAMDGQDLVRSLDILKDDHYIIQTTGKWRFKLGIVRRWWHDQRGHLDI